MSKGQRVKCIAWLKEFAIKTLDHYSLLAAQCLATIRSVYA